MMKRILTAGFLVFSTSIFAADVPGGLIRSAVQAPNNTYEMVLSPAYLVSSPAAYLTSELRYQPNEDIALGFGFGAGEVGFNFGVNGTWYVTPRAELEPSFAVLGGVYFNRVSPANYFVFRISPLVSQTYPTNWGSVTPYAGVHLSPCFSLSANNGTNVIALRTSAGAQFALKDMGGLKVWTEGGVNIANSSHEIVIGISYPFTAL